MRIHDRQEFWKVPWRLDVDSGLFRECRKCGKFLRPSRTKWLSYWDIHCFNCGATF